jgi:hypothetical protein
MSEKYLNVDIDHYINRIIPENRLYLLPKRISWFLGYRSEPPPLIGSVLVSWWAFIGAFVGILVVEVVFMTDTLKTDGAPIVIASFVCLSFYFHILHKLTYNQGAAAILEYNTIDSPLAQPRNALLGHMLAAVIGVGITKLFKLNHSFENLRWIAGALSVGVTSAAMAITKTTHPPAGATALLCSTTPAIEALGWFLLPLILIGTILLLAVACLINNIQRQFPIYWWTPLDLSKRNNPGDGDIERQKDSGKLHYENAEGSEIIIDSRRISLPEWILLDQEERSMLEVLRSKLLKGFRNTSSRDTDKTRVHYSP